jgi:hypothetical protein
MQSIHLSDQLYNDARRHAANAGFVSVDDFIADLVRNELDEPTDYAKFFTPERLAMIDEAVADLDAGKGISAEKVHDDLRRRFGE